MTSATEDETRRQEDLFGEEFPSLAGGLQARAKALQQLAVSEDSPFNLTSIPSRPLKQVADHEQLQRRREKEHLLREETEEIKRQLELVKSHLNEFKLNGGGERRPEASRGCNSGHHCHHHCNRSPSECEGAKTCRSQSCHHLEKAPEMVDKIGQTEAHSAGAHNSARRPVQSQLVTDQQQTSADSQFHSAAASSACSLHPTCGLTDKRQLQAVESPSDSVAKFRPLTGKTDCPNCCCDRRRSVCDKCIRLQTNVVQEPANSGHKQSESSSLSRGEPKNEFKRQPTLLTEQKIAEFNSSPRSSTLVERQIGQLHLRDYDERPIRPARKKLEDLLDETAPTPNQTVPKTIEASGGEQTVDQVVVPQNIYTIGKSLNEKRKELAQIIEELQIVKDKVEKRGDRLEQERQIAKLYRDQWKFGPTIGGRTNSRESIAASNYQSRLDPNLARDSKSMMGFQHIEPTLKLRQYDKSPSRAQSNAVPPKPKPRLSKLVANSRPVVLVARDNYRRPTQASALHSRSKSLDSLPRQRSTLADSKTKQQAAARPIKAMSTKKTSGREKVQSLGKGKSSSEMNLSSPAEGETRSSTPDQGVEEDLEEEIRDEDLDSVHSEDGPREKKKDRQRLDASSGQRKSSPDGGSETKSSSGASSPSERDDRTQAAGHENSPAPERPQDNRAGWVPVFGETEIKTVQRRPVERKVIVLNSSTRNMMTSQRREAGFGVATRSILRTGGRTNVMTNRVTRAATGAGRMQASGPGNDRVLMEAKKKLQFASDLLDREHLDSRTRNQLIVKNRQVNVAANRAQPLGAKPVRAAGATNGRGQRWTSQSAASSAAGAPREEPAQSNGRDESTTTSDLVQGTFSSENREIARLESMISEQQRLLAKLTSAAGDQTQEQVSPGPCSCCRQTPPSPTGFVCTRPHQTSGRQLIGQLRERLNKTRARLARTLEEERARHQRLERRFDSSLRKQSDLEAENELLKKSLSKCIDTCLKDISNTFESLGEHLNESVQRIESADQQAAGSSRAGSAEPAEQTSAPLLANAAQLIADNGHLRRMKQHIDTIEQQLDQERQRSQQLELELQQSKLKIDQLVEAKQRPETPPSSSNARNSDRRAQIDAASPDRLAAPSAADSNTQRDAAGGSPGASAANRATTATSLDVHQQLVSESSLASDDPTTSATFSSIDLYRQFIQSMAPDFDGIRRERRMILNEFDNFKRMLSDMDM